MLSEPLFPALRSVEIKRAYSSNVGGLESHWIDLEILREIYVPRRTGVTESEFEWRYLNKPQGHGKLFAGMVREQRDIKTERKLALKEERNSLVDEFVRLKALLRKHGIDPT